MRFRRWSGYVRPSQIWSERTGRETKPIRVKKDIFEPFFAFGFALTEDALVKTINLGTNTLWLVATDLG